MFVSSYSIALSSVAILVSYSPALLFPNFPFGITEISIIWRIPHSKPGDADHMRGALTCLTPLPQITESFSKVRVLPPWQEEPLICPSHPRLLLLPVINFISIAFHPSPTCVDVFNKMWNEIHVHSVPYYPATYQGNTESWHGTQGGILHASVPPTQSRAVGKKRRERTWFWNYWLCWKSTKSRYSITTYFIFSSNKKKKMLSLYLLISQCLILCSLLFQCCVIFSVKIFQLRLWLDSAHLSQGFHSIKIIAGSCLKWE